MDLKLSTEDLKKIELLMEKEKIFQYLMRKDALKFNIGDILICKKANYYYNDSLDDFEPKWQIETTSSINGLPRRYVYVHEDQFGIGYVKRLRVTDGELGDELICLATVDHQTVKFEVDPLFLDSVLLGEGGFDIRALQQKEKERKKEVVEFNKKSAFKSNKLSDINNFLLSLPIGGSFYIENGTDYYGMYFDKIEIQNIQQKFISQLPSDIKEDVASIGEGFILDTKKVVAITYSNNYSGKCTYYSHELFDQNLYNNKPLSIVGDDLV